MGLSCVLPIVIILLWHLHTIYGWQSFAQLAPLDVSLDLFSCLCTLHCAVLWTLVFSIGHLFCVTDVGSSKADGHGPWLTNMSIWSLVIGSLWSVFLLSIRPISTARRVFILEISLQRCGIGAQTLGHVLLLLALAIGALCQPGWRLAAVIARSSTVTTVEQPSIELLHDLLEDACLAIGTCIVHTIAFVQLIRLWFDRTLHTKMLALRRFNLKCTSSSLGDGDEHLEDINEGIVAMYKLPAHIMRHVVARGEERALRFGRHGCRVWLLMLQEGGPGNVEIVRHERYLQLADDLHSVRWSWTNTLHIDQITSVKQREHEPLEFIVTFSTLNAEAEPLRLSMETSNPEHSRLWVVALELLLRASRFETARLPTSTLRRIKVCFKLAARSHEALASPRRELAFFEFLNLGMSAIELRRLHACAAEESYEDHAQGHRDHSGSYQLMLQIYHLATRSRDVAAVHNRYSGRSDKEKLQASTGISLEDFQRFWLDQENLGLVLGHHDTDDEARRSAQKGVARRIFVQMAGSSEEQLSIDAFQRLLLSSANSAVDPLLALLP